jgi:hypothetical protein
MLVVEVLVIHGRPHHPHGIVYKALPIWVLLRSFMATCEQLLISVFNYRYYICAVGLNTAVHGVTLVL